VERNMVILEMAIVKSHGILHYNPLLG
jgi:hypothetical protein